MFTEEERAVLMRAWRYPSPEALGVDKVVKFLQDLRATRANYQRQLEENTIRDSKIIVCGYPITRDSLSDFRVELARWSGLYNCDPDIDADEGELTASWEYTRTLTEQEREERINWLEVNPPENDPPMSTTITWMSMNPLIRPL